jgi:hypothetical protein
VRLRFGFWPVRFWFRFRLGVGTTFASLTTISTAFATISIPTLRPLAALAIWLRVWLRRGLSPWILGLGRMPLGFRFWPMRFRFWLWPVRLRFGFWPVRFWFRFRLGVGTTFASLATISTALATLTALATISTLASLASLARLTIRFRLRLRRGLRVGIWPVWLRLRVWVWPIWLRFVMLRPVRLHETNKYSNDKVRMD